MTPVRALAAAALGAATAAAEGPAVSSAPVIADIRVERANVFNPAVPGESWWPFRMANRIHVVTREPVVRQELLFAPGDRWDALQVIQSERNLRANGSFRYAEIAQVPRPDGRVDALTRTQDSWTTNPKLAFGTEGGQSFFSYGLQENNLLGYGKSLGFNHDQNGASRTNAVGYGDPRFLGTRLSLSGGYSRSQFGDSVSASLARPFYALDAERGVAAAWSRGIGEQALLRDAQQFTKFNASKRTVDAAYGRLLSDDRAFVQRAEAGWYAEKDGFLATGDTRAGTLPADRELSGPTAGYSWVQARYVKETYIDRMERVEDFNLGNELHARAGFMGRNLGGDRDRWIYNLSDQQGLSLGPGRFVLAQVGASGRVTGGRRENELLTAGLNLFWKNLAWSRQRTLVAHLEGAAGYALDGENQVVLGGNSGLRGYKNNSFAGAKSVLLNLEDRFFLPGEWFHLVRFGGAVFFDSGAVAPAGTGLAWSRVKSDVGAGLRLASTRSQSGGVLRLDLAYALNGGPGGSRWVVSLRGGQAFSLFNSASGGVAASPASRL